MYSILIYISVKVIIAIYASWPETLVSADVCIVKMNFFVFNILNHARPYSECTVGLCLNI